MNKINFTELNLLNFFFKDTQNGQLIDVGAHHGTVSMTFAKKGWQVIAFEPEEKNRQALERNAQQLKNIKIYPKAVSDIDNARIPFYVSNTHYGIHSIKPFHDTHQFAYEVDTITLNTILKETGLNNVTFLKVDTEGADFLALKGFDVEKYSPEVIMLEFMDDRSLKNFNYTHHDVVKYMKGKNYICFVSEWAPIVQYGIEGVPGEAHTWIQCRKYPINHEPSWGNLIFVRKDKYTEFKKILSIYISSLTNKETNHYSLKKILKKIPGLLFIYRFLKSIFR